MRYMMMIKANPGYEAGKPPNPGLIEAMGRLADEMTRTGVMLAVGGLQPSFAGTRIRLDGGKRSVTDGPFTETKELVGGYAILQAASRDEALALAQRCVDVHAAAGVTDFELEIRPMWDTPLGCAEPAAAAGRT